MPQQIGKNAMRAVCAAHLSRQDVSELRKRVVQNAFSIILHKGPQQIFSLHARLASTGIKLAEKALYGYLKEEKALFDLGWRTHEKNPKEHGYWFINPKVFLEIKAQEINLQNAIDIAGQIIYLGDRPNVKPFTAAIETLEELLKKEPTNPNFLKCSKAFRVAHEMAQKEIRKKSWYGKDPLLNKKRIHNYLKYEIRSKIELWRTEINLARQEGPQNGRITEILEEILFVRQTLKKIEAKGFKVAPKVYDQLGKIENQIFEL